MSSHHGCYLADRITYAIFSVLLCVKRFLQDRVCLNDSNCLFFAIHFCLISAAPFPVIKNFYMHKLNISSSNVIAVIIRWLSSFKVFTVKYLLSLLYRIFVFHAFTIIVIYNLLFYSISIVLLTGRSSIIMYKTLALCLIFQRIAYIFKHV